MEITPAVAADGSALKIAAMAQAAAKATASVQYRAPGPASDRRLARPLMTGYLQRAIYAMQLHEQRPGAASALSPFVDVGNSQCIGASPIEPLAAAGSSLRGA